MNEGEGIMYPASKPQSGWFKWLVAFILILLAFVLYWWYEIYRSAIKNTITKVIETDEQGRKIIEVTGDGGNDDGKSVQGYELPGSIEENKFPFTVIVAPNQKLFGYFGIGEKKTFTHQRGDSVIWRGTIGDASGEYIITYPQLRTTAVGSVN